jgi:hypothetical protein
MKEEPIVHEIPISHEEKSIELEIEEDDEEEMKSDLYEKRNQGYERYIEQWFQSIIRLVQCFLPYFIESHLPQLISYIFVHFKVQISKPHVNIFLLMLCRWLHWKFVYT